MPGDAEKVAAVRAELEGLLEEVEGAEDFSRILRLPLQAPSKPFAGDDGFRWLYLPLWSCEALGVPWQRAVPVALAMELLVAASDLFDDLADRDSPALAGLDEADVVNAGSALLVLAYRALSQAPSFGVPAARVPELVGTFSSFALRAAGGQHLDFHLLAASQEASEERYFRVVERKTGSFSGCACWLGAQVAAADNECLHHFGEYGRCLGVAFQIANDLAFLVDFRSQKADIRARKLTLPVVYGLTCIPGQDGDLLRAVYGGRLPVTEDVERQIRELLTTHGALFYARVQENLWRLRALEHLAATPAVGAARDCLEKLAQPLEKAA